MPIYQVFRFRNHALVMALAAAYPLASHASTARVDFAAGSVVAVNAAGSKRSLAKGAEVGNGEMVVTGDGGRAQLRFSDGALISLQPGTEFRIDDYRFSGKADGQEKGFFSLIKGGMRTITGLIGRSNRSNYQVTTAVATIGIRGTEYTAGLNPAGTQLLVHTGEGLVEVCNNAGCMLLGSGDSGSVTGRDSKPQRTESRPQLPPAQPITSVTPTFSSADVVGGDFIPTSPMPTSGTGTYSAILNQTSGSATLTSASMSVNFGTYSVSTNIGGKVGGVDFTGSGSGTITGSNFAVSGPSWGGSFCVSACTGSISGTFYGPAAERAGINYSITSSGSGATGSGTAIVGK